MISESLVHLGEKKSGIRELFEYGLRQAAIVGKENVYDYSLGNPSVPAPEEVASIIRELLEGDSLALHGYTPAGGAKEAQQAVADDLTQRSGDTIRPENIFFTCGAAPALVAVLRALAVEDAEFVAIAPYFPEYQVFVSYNGGKIRRGPARYEEFSGRYRRCGARAHAAHAGRSGQFSEQSLRCDLQPRDTHGPRCPA